MTRIKDISGTTTSAASDDYVALDGSTNGSRKILASDLGGFVGGCLVTFSADVTGFNGSSGAVVTQWDTESYDTDSFHDNSTNPARLTVPSGVSKVRLVGQIGHNLFSGNGTALYVEHYNSVGTQLYPDLANGSGSNAGYNEANLQVSGPVISVSAGDYFQCRIWSTDSSITLLKNRSYFAIEVIE